MTRNGTDELSIRNPGSVRRPNYRRSPMGASRKKQTTPKTVTYGQLESAAKAAYIAHQTRIAAGTEIWAWEDLDPETRQHWKDLANVIAAKIK
jgi:hypothetical protein